MRLGETAIIHRGCYLLCLFVAGAAAAQISSQAVPKASGNSGPDLQTLVSRRENAQAENREHYRAYTVIRQYRLYGGESQRPNSEVIADVSFVPPSEKTYKIEKASGSDRGEKVVRKILDRESEMASSQRIPVSRENYNFTYLGEDALDGHSCYLLGLEPKRKDRDLIKGRAWVDKETYLIHQVQGAVAKNPSWWVKDVSLTLRYHDIAGMWLQNDTHAVADIRLFGRHTLTARALEYRTAEAVAGKRDSTQPFSPVAPSAARRAVRTRRSIQPTSIVGAGILVER
jgi:hypothetical protein